MADAQLSVELKAEIRAFLKAMRDAEKQTKDTSNTVDNAADKIKGYIAGAFSVGAIISFGKAVIDATAEYQKFGAVLGNTLGSSALANLKLKELQDFAAKTPFSVNELTASYVKLANAGFKPTGEQLTKLGDLASSTGKTFDELTEAILDAQSGEFERLKEFGIRAKDAGDKVIFTYKGVQTQVEKTSGSIRDYITSLGGAEGVSGSMAVISETLGGKISNLGDSWDQMLISVGKNTSGVFTTAIGVISASIDKVTELNQQLDIASKYKINGGFKDVFETLYKYSAGGLAGGAQSTTKEKRTGAIAQTQQQIQNFVSSAITGAKTAADFGKALSDLKAKGAKGAGLQSFKGDQQVLAGVADAYKEGVKAIQDARNNFNKEAGAKDGNFGKGAGKGKAVKSVADILNTLNENLRVTENQFGDTFDDKTANAIKNYQTAINDLAKKNTPDAIEAIGKLNEMLTRTQQLGQNATLSGSVNQFLPQQRDSQGNVGISGIQVSDPSLEAFKKRDKLLDKIRSLNADINNELTNGLTSGVEGFGAAIGDALANGGSVIDSIGASLLGSFGSLLTQLGGIAIKVGIGMQAIKTALKSLNPAVAIAAGIGLVALGAFFSSKASSVGDGIKGGSSGGNVTAFANGGVVYGPTNALIGEYAGAKSNPEVVAPLSKLKDIIGRGSANNPNRTDKIVVMGENVIRGKDIVTIYNKSSESNRRIG